MTRSFQPADPNLQKHSLNLFRGDYERIQELNPDIGAAVVIRSIVRKWIEQCESTQTPNLNPPEIQL